MAPNYGDSLVGIEFPFLDDSKWGRWKEVFNLVKRTMYSDLVVGDILHSKSEDYFIKVVEVRVGYIVGSDTGFSIRDAEDNLEDGVLELYSFEYLKGLGYKRLDVEDRVELTMNEIAEKFGMDVDRLKIRKD